MFLCLYFVVFFFFKQKTAYEMRIRDWSSDVCSSDLLGLSPGRKPFLRLGDTRVLRTGDAIRLQDRAQIRVGGNLFSNLRRDVVYRHGLAWRPTATCQNPTDARQQSVGHAANNAALNRISEAVHQWVVVRVLGRDEIDTGGVLDQIGRAHVE